MSSPAVSWARRCTETASSYCSRKRELTMASRNVRVPSTAVYQDGRGSEPMIEVGSVFPADALNILHGLSRLQPYGSIAAGCSIERENQPIVGATLVVARVPAVAKALAG